MGRRSSDLQLQTLAAGSAGAMPYAHPTYQPPYGHGSCAAPQQMITSLSCLQEVASSRQCQMPCASNCMHPSMSLEAQTHRSMPTNWGTRYVHQPSHLSRDDSSESNRDASLDGDPDSDRHSKEETPCPNSGVPSAKDMEACPFLLAFH